MNFWRKLYKTFVPLYSLPLRLYNIPILYEAFADRNYNEDLTLVSRKRDNAILTNAEEIISHVSRIVFDKHVKSITGKDIFIQADTFCIHGDNPNVEIILKTLHKKFRVA